MLKKQSLHKVFLLVSAIIVFHGTLMVLIQDGRINFGVLRYYTIMSNLLVTIGFIAMVFLNKKESVFRYYFSISIMMSISMTCLAYNFVLVPAGGVGWIFSSYPNFVTHLLSMVLVFINYFIFEKKGMFTFKHVPIGLIFTAVYWIVFLIIGDYINFHPYFFMNPNMIGLPMTFVWGGILLVSISLFGLIILLLDKKLGRKY